MCVCLWESDYLHFGFWVRVVKRAKISNKPYTYLFAFKHAPIHKRWKSQWSDLHEQCFLFLSIYLHLFYLNTYGNKCGSLISLIVVAQKFSISHGVGEEKCDAIGWIYLNFDFVRMISKRYVSTLDSSCDLWNKIGTHQ